ncbi:excinuclease ABC subunit UvrB, partial [Chroococcidiopsis cubana CCALA 043]
TDTAVPLPKSGAEGSYFRKNTLDEMTVGRTEKPVTGKIPEKPKSEPGRSPLSPPVGEMSPQATEGGTPGSRPSNDPRPIIRARAGAGSYEDPMDQKRKGRTKGKTGRPGR